jgi:hypothetical protein
LRSNACEQPPAGLWELYIHPPKSETRSRTSRATRPSTLLYQREERIEAHFFLCFLPYCLHVALTRRLRDLAPGLTGRAMLEKLAAVQMIRASADKRGAPGRAWRLYPPRRQAQTAAARTELELA